MIQQMAVGPLGANAYFIVDDSTKEGFIIDPGAEAERIIAKVKENNWDIKLILLTHGHYDHIAAAEEVSAALDCEIVAYKEAQKYLSDSKANLSTVFGSDKVELEADKYIGIDDKEIKEILSKLPKSLQFDYLYCPGHTTDSIVYTFSELNSAFVGDVIFRQSIGRTDLDGGNHSDLINSIKTEIFQLPDDTKLYPGHGPVTTVEFEKSNNPHVRAGF